LASTESLERIYAKIDALSLRLREIERAKEVLEKELKRIDKVLGKFEKKTKRFENGLKKGEKVFSEIQEIRKRIKTSEEVLHELLKSIDALDAMFDGVVFKRDLKEALRDVLEIIENVKFEYEKRFCDINSVLYSMGFGEVGCVDNKGKIEDLITKAEMCIVSKEFEKAKRFYIEAVNTYREMKETGQEILERLEKVYQKLKDY